MKDLLTTPAKKFRLAVCALIFVSALARYWVSYDPAAVVPRDPETYRIAHSLYERGEFANPFIALPTGPSAHLDPVFPAILAALMWLFGPRSIGMYAIELVGLFVLCFQLSLYPFFSKALGMGFTTGIVGALMWMIAKPYPFYGWEAFYASWVLAGACCLYRRHMDAQTADLSTWALGCLIGVSGLMLPTTLPIFGAWVAWDVWRRRIGFFRRFFLPLAVLPMLIVGLWTIRNYLTFHRFILVRDDLGLELAVSNNDCAQFAMERNFSGCFQQLHPNRSVREARRVIEFGEADYNKLRLREAFDWIKSHPRRFARLSIFRFIAWWVPTETGTVRYPDYPGRGREQERLVIYLMTFLSLPGLVMLCRRDFGSTAICFSCLAIFPLVYYFVQYQDRYRYPIMWLTFLLGSLPIITLARRICRLIVDRQKWAARFQ